MKRITTSILLCITLAGCASNTELPDSPSKPSSCPISTLRTGTELQGIKTYGNGFECTDTGSYFMCTIGTETWLLYTDHGSDTIIKLCGRPDCNHTDKDCNAYFIFANSICYYNGFLYTFINKDDEIIRMNPDGTERTPIYNISSFEKAGGYNGSLSPRIVNGVFFISLTKVDKNGVTIIDSYYYKLDGSMDEPKPVENSFYLNADGESFIVPVYDEENSLYTYNAWDPDKGIGDDLFKTDQLSSYGYIGTKARYYIDNGIIIEDFYTEERKELINTGLKGNYQLACFPDCMVAYEYLSDEELNQGVTLDEVTMHFYDWDCNDLGSVKINYKFRQEILGAGLICGETPERIILTDDYNFAPRYYINKSDLGTGNIEIHAFNLPDFGE